MRLVRRFFEIFLGAVNISEMKKRGLLLSFIVPAYRWFDWFLVGTAATVTGFLKFYGFSNISIFLILWLANASYCSLIIFFNNRTSVDITLMEGFRRLINKALEKSKFYGRLAETVFFFRIIIWDGADSFVIFFKEKIKSRFHLVASVLFASGFQMLIWTSLYIFGYENFSDLFKSLVD